MVSGDKQQTRTLHTWKAVGVVSQQNPAQYGYSSGVPVQYCTTDSGVEFSETRTLPTLQKCTTVACCDAHTRRRLYKSSARWPIRGDFSAGASFLPAINIAVFLLGWTPTIEIWRRFYMLSHTTQVIVYPHFRCLARQQPGTRRAATRVGAALDPCRHSLPRSTHH